MGVGHIGVHGHLAGGLEGLREGAWEHAVRGWLGVGEDVNYCKIVWDFTNGILSDHDLLWWVAECKQERGMLAIWGGEQGVVPG
jgi:hypothetical protein